MTWSISKGGPKADVIAAVNDVAYGGDLASDEAKAFEAFKGALLAQLEAFPLANVSVSASGSTTSCSISCSCWA